MGTFSVTVICREVTYSTCFLLNSLCPKTMEMTVDLKQRQLKAVDLIHPIGHCPACPYLTYPAIFIGKMAKSLL